VGIGTDSPTSKLTVAGTLTVGGTIQASGGSSVMHDATLNGNGTSASPLGVAIPLTLSGSPAPGNGILTVRNFRSAGEGVIAGGGNLAGIGIRAVGGSAHGAGHTSGDGLLAAAGSVFVGATAGHAAIFLGDVQITGNFEASGTKNFKIDHPLDPENKYLNHAAI